MPSGGEGIPEAVANTDREEEAVSRQGEQYLKG